jgi:hypothetical protein
MPRATSRSSAQILLRRSELTVKLRRRAGHVPPREPQVKRERDDSLLRAVVKVVLEAAALGIGGRNDPGTAGAQLPKLGADLGLQTLVLERWAGRARDLLHQLGLLECSGPMADRRQKLPVGGQLCHGGGLRERDRRPGAVDPACFAIAVHEDQVWLAESAGQCVAHAA